MSIEDGRKRGVSGAIGVPIPDDAPADRTALPLQPAAIAAAVDAAAANERELAPLRPAGPPLTPTAKIAQLQALGLPIPPELAAADLSQPQLKAPAANRRLPRPAMTVTGVAAEARADTTETPGVVARPVVLGPDQRSSPEGVAAGPRASAAARMPNSGWPLVDLPAGGAELIDAQDQPTAPMAGELPQPGDDAYGAAEPLPPLAPLTDADRARMPAASNTDSPARGLPKPVAPDKAITGGFADTLDAQYFPLSGDELGVLITAQLEFLKDLIKSDLRFSLALTYPRVRAKISIEIEGDVEDAGFRIPRLVVPADGAPGSTPIAIARAHADEICFVVQTLRQEFDATNESDMPPDAIRDELGLAKPGKRMIIAGGRRVFVDVLPEALAGGGR